METGFHRKLLIQLFICSCETSSPQQLSRTEYVLEDKLCKSDVYCCPFDLSEGKMKPVKTTWTCHLLENSQLYFPRNYWWEVIMWSISVDKRQEPQTPYELL